MDKGYMKLIRGRIIDAPDGSVFTAADFADVADTATIRKSLNRLLHDKQILNVLRGVYVKPKFSSLLNEYVSVDPDAVAKALARNYHWSILPSGNTALNLLGLSQQVTASWNYISDGPYKTYEWDNTKIVFKHRTNREITGLSYKSGLVIQGIKELGKERTDKNIIIYLSDRLDSSEKEALLRESAESSDWVVDIVRKICLGGKE